MATQSLHVRDDAPGGVVRLSEPRPSSRLYIQPTSISTVTNWSIAAIRTALAAHDQGDFAGSAALADSVRCDGQIHAALETRVSPVMARSALPFMVEASRGIDDRRAEALARRIQTLWPTSCQEPQLAAFLRDAVMLGVAVGRDDMPLVDGEEVPRLRRLRPLGLNWDEHEASFKYIDKNGVTHTVTPGENGWVLHAPFGPDSWMYGAVRALGLLYAMRAYAFRDHARWNERHGLPILAVKEPHFASDDVERTKDLYNRLAKLGSESVIRLQQGSTPEEGGWDLKWLEPVTLSFQGFSRLYQDIRHEFIAVLLGRDPESGSKGVGGDEAALKESVRNQYIQADLEGLATTLREQLWKPWVLRNVDARRGELTPWPRWETRPPTDMGRRADQLIKAADAIERLERLNIDTTEVREEFKLRLRSGDTPTLPKLEPPSNDEPAEPDTAPPQQET